MQEQIEQETHLTAIIPFLVAAGKDKGDDRVVWVSRDAILNLIRYTDDLLAERARRGRRLSVDETKSLGDRISRTITLCNDTQTMRFDLAVDLNYLYKLYVKIQETVDAARTYSAYLIGEAIGYLRIVAQIQDTRGIAINYLQ